MVDLPASYHVFKPKMLKGTTLKAHLAKNKTDTRQIFFCVVKEACIFNKETIIYQIMIPLALPQVQQQQFLLCIFPYLCQ